MNAFKKYIIGFSIVGFTIATSLSVGLFWTLNDVSNPNIRYYSQANYDKDKIDKNPTRYDKLQTIGTSTLEAAKGTKTINNGNYIFTFGSNAYAETNLALYGHSWNAAEFLLNSNSDSFNVISDALLPKLYDVFYGGTSVSKPNTIPYFVNYIDVINTRSIIDSEDEFEKKQKETYTDANGNKINKIDKTLKFSFTPENLEYSVKEDKDDDAILKKYRDPKGIDTYLTITDFLNNYWGPTISPSPEDPPPEGEDPPSPVNYNKFFAIAFRNFEGNIEYKYIDNGKTTIEEIITFYQLNEIPTE